VSDVWVIVVVVGAATMALKAVGPVVLAGRELPPTLSTVLLLLAPALLGTLVVTQAVGGDREIVLDERLVGIGAAIVAILLRLPLLAVVVIAAAVTAGLRALG
jgi:Branched-chain amino acid transport protein (AzlD)